MTDKKAILSALGTCRSEIGRRIRSAQKSSENEVFAIGQCINNIVEQTKELVGNLDAHRRLHAEGRAQTSAMIKELMASVHQQDEWVQRAMSQSSAILRAGQDVQSTASATRLLSLNARVEASRLGEQGSSFSVIADEMRQLSHAVQQTNSAIAMMARDLERLLPQISEQNRTIHARFEQFAHHVEGQLDSLNADEFNSDNSPVIERIMDLAYTALSHLSFQDPMSQSLARIDNSLQWLRDRVEGKEEEPASTPDAENGENHASPGEVMIF